MLFLKVEFPKLVVVLIGRGHEKPFMNVNMVRLFFFLVHWTDFITNITGIKSVVMVQSIVFLYLILD